MLNHNHIFQYEHGKSGCPACATIDDYNMTEEYAILQSRLLAMGW